MATVEKNMRIARFTSMQQQKFKETPDRVSGFDRCVKIGPDGTEASAEGLTPRHGAVPIPSQSVLITNTMALRRMDEEEHMTQWQDGTRVEERLADTFSIAAAVDGMVKLDGFEDGPFGMLLAKLERTEAREEKYQRAKKAREAAGITTQIPPIEIVDIKPMKRVKYGDDNVQDKYVWLELHGLDPNDPGWIKDSPASHIAFERFEDFVVIPRAIVRRFVWQSGVIDHQSAVSENIKALNKVRTLNHRYDLWSLVDIEAMIKHDFVKDYVEIWRKVE